MARTDTEVYRRFEGELQKLPLRFWPITASGFRVAVKKKLPLLLLLAPPAIATIIFAFIVYGKFTLEAQMEQGDVSAVVAMAGAGIGRMLEVRGQIIQFIIQMQFFGLLVVAWFGAGLIAEDQRLGAHQLYFSRPLTRLDYFLGKFLTVAIFGCFAMVLPGIVICAVATFASPEWSFLKEQGDVIWKTVTFGLGWVVVNSVGVLAFSSVVKRKRYALAGAFAFFMINEAMAGALAGLLDNDNYLAVGVFNNLVRIAEWMFQVGNDTPFGPMMPTWPIAWSFSIVGGVTAVCLGIIAWRLRKLEVVG